MKRNSERQDTAIRPARNKELFAELRSEQQADAFRRARENPNKKEEDYAVRDWNYYNGY